MTIGIAWRGRHGSPRYRLALALALGLCLGSGAPAGAFDLGSAARDGAWVASWAASPQQPIDPVFGGVNPPTLAGMTIREIVRLSTGGFRIRLRLTNEFTNATMLVGAAHVALSAANPNASPPSPSSAIVPGTDHAVTFGGAAGITLAPNAAALSDPIDLPVKALTSLAVSIYVSDSTAPATPHSLGVQTAYLASGNQAGAASLAGATTIQSRYVLSSIETLAGPGAATIVTFGDSITDGYASTPDANKRWPDDLAARLANSWFGKQIAVANEGISGNRLRLEGIGPNAQSRFDRDVLSRPNVRFVTVLEGINDIGFPFFVPTEKPPTPDDITAVYRQLIARAHEHGIRIYGCTLTPYQGSGYYSAVGETTREAVNQWIRTSGEFDAVIDFDKVTRDPANPTRFLAAYDSGDHLHPSDAGYQAMANSVDLKLFWLPELPGFAAR